MQIDFPSRCDAVVIGAGPAGSAAAIEMARSGMDVVLLEKRRFPREKVCGCCLNLAAAQELSSLGAAEVMDSWIPTRSLEIRAAGESAILPHKGGVLSRGRLDSTLLTLAGRSGARVLTQAIAHVQPETGKFARTVRVSIDGMQREIEATCVIAADGIGGSSLRELPEFDWRVEPDALMGLGCLVQGEAGPSPGRILMGVANAGYVGLVRLENGLTDVAAATKPDFVRSCGDGSRAIRRLCDAAGIEGIEPRGPVHGTPLLTRTRGSVESGRVIVVGDASAYVEPFTGEGMSWALWSGRRAALWAQATVRGLTAGDWAAELNRGLSRRRWACRMVAKVLRQGDRCKGIVEAAGALPRCASWISGRFGRPWPQPVFGGAR